MAKRVAACLAVIAVVVHCVIGCCTRCVNACEAAQLDEIHVCCVCHDYDAWKVEGDLCCQPATNSPTASESTEQGEHACLGCGKHKCPFILSESPASGLTETLLSPVCLIWCDASFEPRESVPTPNQCSFLGLSLPHSQAKLRLHLCLAVLTL